MEVATHKKVRAGYKATELGVIPEDWSTATVSDYFSINTGSNTSYTSIKNGLFLIEMGSISEQGKLLFNKKVFFTKNLVPKNALVMPTRDIGEGRIVGKVALIKEGNTFALGNNVYCLVSKTEEVDVVFFKYLFNSPWVNASLKQKTSKSVQIALNKSQVEKQFIYKPETYNEQKTIASALSDIDSYIDSLSKLIEKKKNIKTAAKQQLLTGKKRLPGFSGEWEKKKLSDLCLITMGQSPSSQFYNRNGQGLPLIQGNADIKNRRTIKRVWTTNYTKLCEKGDIIMTVRAPVGFVGVATDDACLGRGVCGLKPCIDKTFLMYSLIFNEDKWSAFEQGSTFTAANSKQVNDFEVRVSLEDEENKAIGIVLDAMTNEIDSLNSKLYKAIKIKEGMMHELLTGNIRLV